MRFQFESNGTLGEVSIERQGDEYRALINGQTHAVKTLNIAPGCLDLMFDGHPLRVHWAESGGKKWIALEDCVYLLERPAGSAANRAAGRSIDSEVHAPMPAQVRAVLVEAGEPVNAGQLLMLLEAMKMEIRITAPYSGTLLRIDVETGQTVQKDQPLLEIERDSP